MYLRWIVILMPRARSSQKHLAQTRRAALSIKFHSGNSTMAIPKNLNQVKQWLTTVPNLSMRIPIGQMIHYLSLSYRIRVLKQVRKVKFQNAKAFTAVCSVGGGLGNKSLLASKWSRLNEEFIVQGINQEVNISEEAKDIKWRCKKFTRWSSSLNIQVWI